MSTASVLVVGESLVDIIARPDGIADKHAGGSAANVAVALARLGRPVQFLTALGDDEHGAVLAYLLNQSGVGIVGDPHTLSRTAAHPLGFGPSAIIITRGGHGATWIADGLRVDIPASHVHVADTIGAGDTFGAATIDALWDFNALGGRLPTLDSAQIESVLRHAVRAAAVTVSRSGADPPYKQELL